MAKVRFYFDEMMPRAPVQMLAQKSLEVVMANDVLMTGKVDSEHLAYAAEHGLVVVTFDRPFAGRSASRTDHQGLICLSGSQQDIGYIVRTLIKFAETYEAGHMLDRCFGFEITA